MADRLTRINQEIAEHRRLYLLAIWAGHDGEAEEHTRAVDRLLDLHNQVTAHPTFTTS